mgnify:CR=1 FL=1|jgi:hypothetical protein
MTINIMKTQGIFMISDVVVARALGGEPLKRVAVGKGERVIYIANPDRLEAIGRGDSEPVGFPKADIVVYDPMVYEALHTQWSINEKTDPALWMKLRRYDT